MIFLSLFLVCWLLNACIICRCFTFQAFLLATFSTLSSTFLLLRIRQLKVKKFYNLWRLDIYVCFLYVCISKNNKKMYSKKKFLFEKKKDLKLLFSIIRLRTEQLEIFQGFSSNFWKDEYLIFKLLSCSFR